MGAQKVRIYFADSVVDFGNPHVGIFGNGIDAMSIMSA
jgi:hypothetical protein